MKYFGSLLLLLLAGCALRAEGPTSGSSGTTSGGATGGGDTSAVGASGTTAGAGGGSASATGGAGGAPQSCDALSCGDFGSGCIGCAVQGACKDPYATCVNSQPCYDFSQCAAACEDDANACAMKCGADPMCQSACDDGRKQCVDGCAAQNPDGADAYMALVTCVVCDACPTACSQHAQACK